MKKKWSRNWKSSKQPRKQRKYLFNAPLHIARKFMSVRLSKELKQKHSKRNFPVRKSDKVKINVGQFKGKIGKVDSVDIKHRRVYIEEIFITKKDGNKVRFSFHPSNLTILELNLEDKLRRKAIERK